MLGSISMRSAVRHARSPHARFASTLRPAGLFSHARVVKRAAEEKRVWPDPNNPDIAPYTGYDDQSGDGGKGGGSGRGGSGGSGAGGEDEDGSRLPLATIFLAILLLVGGFMGYKESKSTKSAIAGCGSAAVLFLSYALMNGASAPLGFCLACGTTLVLGIVMTKRYAKTRKFMPAGLIAALSTLYTILYLTSGRMA